MRQGRQQRDRTRRHSGLKCGEGGAGHDGALILHFSLPYPPPQLLFPLTFYPFFCARPRAPLFRVLTYYKIHVPTAAAGGSRPE